MDEALKRYLAEQGFEANEHGVYLLTDSAGTVVNAEHLIRNFILTEFSYFEL